MGIRIGQLAKMADCPVVTIRFYEKEGLLRASGRNHSNYRLYNESDLERLRFILHCRKHGISLKDIRQLLYLKENPQLGCDFVHDLISVHLQKVEDEIQSLRTLQAELLTLQNIRNCDGKGKCAILGKLEENDGCPYCEKAPPGNKTQNAPLYAAGSSQGLEEAR